ncbi:AcrR family transcriptional regulator/predicted nucleic acid-binding Zn ribbon protein [Streptosporangium lutulentum]|uniref:AcrR family transcriptional regulator/predicted nucleic acid-binding Zn ribbon protein n=2 Tax=Streptosporangium lutulentum TaxID=1461250 RepID=A0ABT9Q9E9_9ACTN|nr:TetR/AcrR family transcriptional regulator [Streptosporangium lutulentum]MDP9842958.1 AcrR family transcriptional regulator/predicted nucleic acid-binding Zn ribbon protein [Streptosporangium lutulentum]
MYATEEVKPVADTEYVNIWMRPERPAYGPKPAYSSAQITEAAIRIADAEGLEAATMRRIAAEIGAGAMSLYRYVPSRDDLIELVADRLMGEIDVEGMPSGDWRADLTRYAHGLRAMWLRHPWIATVQRSIPSFGPNQLRLIERGMGTLDAHVSIDQNLGLMAMLNNYVESAVREEISWAEEARRSGLSESEWMARSSPRVHQLVDSGEYPIFTKIVMESRQPRLSRDDQFRYGLERVLAFIAAALPRPVEPPAEAIRRDRPPLAQPGPPSAPCDETPATATSETPACDETTDDLTPAPRCAVCGDATPETVTGRPRRYCSRACQQIAYRTRKRAGSSG